MSALRECATVLAGAMLGAAGGGLVGLYLSLHLTATDYLTIRDQRSIQLCCLATGIIAGLLFAIRRGRTSPA